MVRNLGVMFDQSMKMDYFVKYKIKVVNLGLRNISRIRKYLTIQAVKSLVQALVISKLDYASSLLIGVNKTYIQHLQLLQNKAARLIFKAKLSDHITPLLRDLHWLKVKERIDFRIIVHV